VTGIFVAIFALAAIAITVFFRRAVVRPLGGLTAATQALSRGNPDGEPPASPESGRMPEAAAHGDEIVQLAGRFDFMTREVYSREERLRQARADVARSEAHFRSLIEYASDAVMVLDASLQVRYASPSLKRVLGFAPEDVAGKSPVRYVNEGDAEAMKRALEAAAATPGLGSTLEFRCAGDGAPKYLEATLANMLDNPAVEGIVVNMRDVTERRRTEELTREKIRAEAQIRQLALYDSLTGLPNRHLFKEQLSDAVARADRSDQALVMLSLNLDRFKRINDTLGREVGDLVLKEVASRLIKSVRQTDYITRSDSKAASQHIARQGGDEFTVLLGELNQAQEATKVARRILEALSQPFNQEGHEIVMSASIGIAVYRLDGNDADTLLKNADAAMHYAKEQGKNNYQYYNDKMNNSAFQGMTLESNLHKALERDEFSLHYQPKIDVKSGSITGAEALIRWRHPDLGLVSPAEFIPMAEESGLIIPIGEWVLDSACAQLRAWREGGLTPVPVAVNLSAKQFHQQNIAAVVMRALQDHSVDPRLLELEITESTAMRNAEATSTTLRDLKALGVRIAIDDFGTGYSSLSYLKRFPIDSLKIDRSFVTDLPGNQDDATIAQAIIIMAHALRLKVIAEGVENEAQLEFLTANGCDEVQGYYFSRPLPAGPCTQLLRDKRKLPLPRGDHGQDEHPAQDVVI
jgi:diguanylate cyclase (GGDEF)-like protein/PAS domain S-box-containing protein